ncbi:maker378, partial [Drosophila busckii]
MSMQIASVTEERALFIALWQLCNLLRTCCKMWKKLRKFAT